MLNRKYLVTWDRKLIAVGYNYNTRKFLYFVATEDTGSTKACIPYLYSYPDQFVNVAIRTDDFPPCRV